MTDTNADEPVEDLATETDELVREVAATPQQTVIMRHALTAWADSHGLPTDLVADIALAATEAMANVVDHAYPPEFPGTLHLTATATAGFVTVTVIDTGRWNDTPTGPNRGRGTSLIRALAPETAITSTPTGTTVRMTWPWTTTPPGQT
ncbi:ATP-binding protein [Actinokineospora sp. 24-640]